MMNEDQEKFEFPHMVYVCIVVKKVPDVAQVGGMLDRPFVTVCHLASLSTCSPKVTRRGRADPTLE